MSSTTAHSIEAELGYEIISLVPHWYQASCAPMRFSLNVGELAVDFCDHFELTSRLQAFLAKVVSQVSDLPFSRFAEYPGLTDVLLESLIITWLRLHSDSIRWVPLLKYLGMLARRTSENAPVSLNLIVRAGKGSGDISQPSLQKFVDRLGSSPFVYLVIDHQLQLIDYAEVSRQRAAMMPSSTFVPTFLQPIHNVMQDGDFSLHVTPFGDLIIMNGQGVLASRRHGKWKVFDIPAFRRSLYQCLENEFVATNLLDIVLELSFTRQGALFIYDPLHRMRGHILNPDSIVSERWTTNAHVGLSGQSLFSRLLKDVEFGNMTGTLQCKRRLLEIATVDGAVVFDDLGLLAIGAIVTSHPDVGSQLGARATATRSSYLWGAHPTAVSSDGEVSVLFRSANGQDKCDALMQF